MANNIDQYLEKVNTLLSALPSEVQRINDGLAWSVIPLMVKRITDLGVDGTGKKLGSYSTNPLPTFFYLNKGLGSGADTALKALEASKKKSEGENYKGISYSEFRQINGKTNPFINLSFSGETLNDIAVLDNVVNGVLVVTTVGVKGSKTKVSYKADGTKNSEITTTQLMDFLAERYGEDILKPNPTEEEMMSKAYDEELQNVFDKYLEA